LKPISFLFLFCLWVGLLKAQNQNSDFEILKEFALNEKKEVIQPKAKFGWIGKTLFSKYNPVSLLLSSALFGYQRIVSPQINADCPYSISCSGFAKACLKRYGLFKGTALGVDRLTRCNRMSMADIHPVRFAPSGKILDLPEFYHFHD
jgi:putative component of membrane protein insertase Oxa1/YidC/SpoIIIJ protein YidD